MKIVFSVKFVFGDFECGQMAYYHFFTKHMGLDGTLYIFLLETKTQLSWIYCSHLIILEIQYNFRKLSRLNRCKQVSNRESTSTERKVKDLLSWSLQSFLKYSEAPLYSMISTDCCSFHHVFLLGLISANVLLLSRL